MVLPREITYGYSNHPIKVVAVIHPEKNLLEALY